MAHYDASGRVAPHALRNLEALGEVADRLVLVSTAAARILGPDHPTTVLTRSNLALARCQLRGDQIRVLGPEHPDILATRHNLAAVREKLGQPNHASDAYEGLVRDLLRVLGPYHPDTLRARRAYAWWLGRSGQPARAVAELE